MAKKIYKRRRSRFDGAGAKANAKGHSKDAGILPRTCGDKGTAAPNEAEIGNFSKLDDVVSTMHFRRRYAISVGMWSARSRGLYDTKNSWA